VSHRRRSPRPLSAALARSREQWQPSSPLGRTQTAWDEVGRAWAAALGPQGAYVLARTTPVSLRAGVLTVSCSESVVAETLELESATVIARLNAQLTDDPVTRLRCVTGA
jgi:hypothetical protein